MLIHIQHHLTIDEQVLNTTIMEDLDKVNKRVKETSQKLRQERVRLIKLKVSADAVDHTLPLIFIMFCLCDFSKNCFCGLQRCDAYHPYRDAYPDVLRSWLLAKRRRNCSGRLSRMTPPRCGTAYQARAGPSSHAASVSRQAKEVCGADVDIDIDSGVSADDEDLNAMLMQGVSDSEVAKTEESVSGVSGVVIRDDVGTIRK